jgi:hypothetical protein
MIPGSQENLAIQMTRVPLNKNHTEIKNDVHFCLSHPISRHPGEGRGRGFAAL